MPSFPAPSTVNDSAPVGKESADVDSVRTRPTNAVEFPGGANTPLTAQMAARRDATADKTM